MLLTLFYVSAVEAKGFSVGAVAKFTVVLTAGSVLLALRICIGALLMLPPYTRSVQSPSDSSYLCTGALLVLRLYGKEIPVVLTIVLRRLLSFSWSSG